MGNEAGSNGQGWFHSCIDFYFIIGIWETINDTIEFFTIGLSDAFLSDYLTDRKLHSTKQILSKIGPSGV